jgi:hypothetical protein
MRLERRKMMSNDLSRRGALALIGAGAAVASPASARVLAAGRSLVEAYTRAWSKRDLTAILACMSPDVDFRSANANSHGREAYAAATARFLPLVDRVDVRAMLADGDRAMIAYDFVCVQPIGTSSVAELLTFKNGLIASSEIFFDTAPFTAFARSRQAAANGGKQ